MLLFYTIIFNFQISIMNLNLLVNSNKEAFELMSKSTRKAVVGTSLTLYSLFKCQATNPILTLRHEYSVVDVQHELIEQNPGAPPLFRAAFWNVLKEISNLLQFLFEENFSVKVLLIWENVCKRSLFLINFSIEICKRYN